MGAQSNPGRGWLAFILPALLFGVMGCGDDGSGPPAAGPPAQLSVVAGDDQTGVVGTELPEVLVVKVVDAHGRPVPGQVVNFRVTSGGGSVFGGSNVTNSAGEARERWTIGTVAGEVQRVEVRAVDNTTGAALVFGTFEATAHSGPPAALRVATHPGVQIRSGVPLEPNTVIELLDRYGNAVKSANVSVTAAIAEPVQGRTLSGVVTASSNAEGVAVFPALAVAGTTGTVVLRFSSPGLTAVSTSALALGSGTPAMIEAVGPTTFTGSAGSVLASLPRVVVRDASGNPVPDGGVTFAVSNGGGVTSPAIAPTDADGTATLTSWTLPTLAGNYTLTATVAGLANASVVFGADVRAGSAARISAVSPLTQAVPAGSSVALAVRVADAFDNSVASAPVTWATVGGSIAATSSTTDATGSAQVTATAPTSVTTTQRVTAAIPGGPSVQFTISATTGAADRLVKFAGDIATSRAGMAVTTPPAVRLVDAFGNPVPGAAVTFAVTAGGGSTTAPTATTDANGVARVGSWTLGPADATVNTLTAAAGSASVAFNVTSTTAIFVGIGSPAQNALVGNAISVSLTAATSAPPGTIASVIVSVADRQTALTHTTSNNWSGTLSVLGLATGQHYFRSLVTDTYGNVRRDSVVVFVNDVDPTLTITSPAAGAVISGSTPVRASCQDDSPGCTVEVSGGVVAKGTGSIDIPAFSVPPGSTRVLVFTARDAAGHTVSETRRVFGESNSRLTRVDSVPGSILDVAAARILFAAGAFISTDTGTPAILDRVTRQHQVVAGRRVTPRWRPLSEGYLTPGGAIFHDRGRIHETDGGVVTDHGVANSQTSLVVKGAFALWSDGTTLRRRDLAARQTIAVPMAAGNVDNDVAANGDVVFWSAGQYDIHRYRAGVTSTLAADPVLWNTYPLTDGTLAVYRKHEPCCKNQQYRIMLRTDAGEVQLAPARTPAMHPYDDYQVNNGWVAWTLKQPSGSLSIQLRSPSGTETTIATAARLKIESLGPDGTVVFINLDPAQRWVGRVTNGTATLTNVSSSLGYSYWVDGSLFVAIGSTLFRAAY